VSATPPPGRTERLGARSVLVLAPHYDDEVLGCGGLVAERAAAGAVVRVLFLTESAGGAEQPADAAYAAERRAESACALAALGVTGAEHLGLPDGALARHRAAASAAIARALLSQRPELVLAPSPLEATSDHRAAFHALFDVLAPVRGGDPLAAVVTHLTVLLYEVNHPAYPDLLIDVGEQVPRIEAAMACYASQEARHPYLRAGLGLRAYRALSLGPEATAVEAYRRLRGEDFAHRGLAGLVHELGGVVEEQEIAEGPRVSVVVRTKDRPALLAQALASLAASSYRNFEVVLVNDGGASPEVSGFPLPLVRVDLPENRGRAAAANAGVAAASGRYVAFLDDDDTVEPEHLATLVGAASAAGVRAVYSDAAVGVYELSGAVGWRRVELRLPYSRDFDAERLLVDNYIPFHTLLVERGLFADVGPLDISLPFFEDWDFLVRLSQLVPLHHLRQVTCEYRQFRGAGHHVLGDRPREREDFLAMKQRVLEKHRALLGPAVVARVVDGLRGEAVAAAEEAASGRRRARDAEESYHSLHGETVALRRERARLQTDVRQTVAEVERLAGEVRTLHGELERQTRELERVYLEESKGRAAVDEQTAQIGKLYAEIQRLEGILRAMENTRAWRLHRWWHRS
jgi:LmbE family N-acetylglucosaminyl deacetylase